jgi:hypothetical protein
MARKQEDPVKVAMAEIAEAKQAGKTELRIRVVNRDVLRAACEVGTVKDLNLSGEIDELPPEIGNLTELDDLSISSMSLRTLPKELGKCTKLTALRAYSNKLTGLPPELGALANLKKAVLWSNELAALPDTIDGWVALTELELQRNKLRRLPDAITRLANLEELDLEHNELAELPAHWSGMARLRKLELGANKLTAFPRGVLELPALRELFLKRNQISALPDDLGRMNTLEVLDLSNNKLATMPAGLWGLAELTNLDVSDNAIVAVPKDIGKLRALDTLDVSGNPIEGVSEDAIRTGRDGVFKALGLLADIVVTGDLPPDKERLAIVKARQTDIDGFVRSCKRKMNDEHVRELIVQFITGKTNVMPPQRREDTYGFSSLPDALAAPDAWTFVDRRIIKFIASRAFYYRQPEHTYFTGYHDEFFGWFKKRIAAETDAAPAWPRVADALLDAGLDADALLRSSLRELDEHIARPDGTPTSYGAWLLAQTRDPARLASIMAMAGEYDGVRSGIVGLLIRNDLALFAKVADKLLVLEASESGEVHLPHEAYAQLCAVDPDKYAPVVLDALAKTTCIGCTAEVAKILAERCGPGRRAKAREVAVATLAGISDRRNKEDRLWFTFDGKIGDGVAHYVDWMAGAFGTDVKDAIFGFAENTKVFDLDVAEAIARHLGQDGVDALAEGLNMTVDGNDLAAHYRRMFAMLAPLDWSKYHAKAWELAASEFREVRQTACFALARLDPAAVLAKALAMMEDKKAHVREAGVLIATLLPGDPAKRQLDALLADETSDDVRDLVVAQRYARADKATAADIAKRVASAKARGKLAKPVAKWLDDGKLGALVWTTGKKADADTVRWLLHRQTRLADIAPEAEARAAYALVDRDKSSGFATKLLALAVKNGGISAKTRFALSVAGLVGDDALIATLEKVAIDAHNDNAATTLGLLGSEAAARALDRIMKAFRVKYPNVREAAQDAFDRIAQQLGVTRFELADRMLPDFGFKNGRGSVALGKVVATVELGADRKLAFADEDGKPIKSPGKGLTGKAKDALEALRDEVDSASRALRTSLEYYMVGGRRWPAAKWRAFFLANPLAHAFARSLVWWSSPFAAARTFRVDASGKLLDAGGAAVKLAADAEVALVHPLDLDDAARAAWTAVLAADALEPPFAQLTRPLFSPKREDRPRARSFEFENKELEGLTFKSRAERLGWRRGSVVDSGAVSAYRKVFERHQIEAFIGTANLGVTSFDGGEVTLEELFFVKAGSVVTGSYTYDEPRDDADPRLIKLGDVPAIVYSETIADLRYVTREPEAQDG